jgi:DNA polymerase elongation subunit (family B)
MSGPRILVLDIETLPLSGFAWGIWQQNIDPLKQIITQPRAICFGAKWHGERKKFFASEYHNGRVEMLTQVRDLIDDADFIYGWNSVRFDRRWLNGEFEKVGLHKAGPARDIDGMKVAKKNLLLPSYKLDYVARFHYGIQGKVSHQGFTLWRDIAIGTPEEQEKAWRKMRQYQLGDIDVTDAVLERQKPSITAFPNPALYGEDGEPEACGCGNTQLQQRGYRYTNLSRYKRYQCFGENGCGAWLSGGRRDRSVDLRRIS